MPFAADLYGDLLDTTPATQSGWRDYFPGLAMTGVAALAAAWLSEHYGAPLMLMGLLIGLAFNFANADVRLHPGLGFASKTLLRWGIVLAGLQITFGQIAGLGWESFLWLAAMIAIVTSVGALTARYLGLGSAFGTLAGGAVAICGASAALALSSVLGEKRSTQAQLLPLAAAASDRRHRRRGIACLRVVRGGTVDRPARRQGPGISPAARGARGDATIPADHGVIPGNADHDRQPEGDRGRVHQDRGAIVLAGTRAGLPVAGGREISADGY